MTALTICVVGGGPLAELAALSLRAALPGGKVTLVTTPVGAGDFADLGNVAGPQIHELHRQFGLTPQQFAQYCKPIACAGFEFQPGNGKPALGFALGDELPFIEGVALHHLAVRAAHEGRFTLDPDWNRAALQWTLRRNQQQSENAFIGFDTRAWLGLMRQASQQLGVERFASRQIRTMPGGEGLAAIVLDDGQQVSADLYVDAAGSASLLRDTLPETLPDAQERSDWLGWMTLWQAAEFGPLQQPVSGLSYRLEGDRMQCASGPVGVQFVKAGQGPIAGQRAGHWLAPWAGNIVAIGDAALEASPLGAMALESGIADVARLVANIPAAREDRSTSKEYNRLACRYYRWLGDWIAACQMMLEGDERDWPAGLAAVLADFDRRGRIALRDGDPVQPGSWLNLLMARGRLPQRVDPVALALDEAAYLAALARLKSA